MIKVHCVALDNTFFVLPKNSTRKKRPTHRIQFYEYFCVTIVCMTTFRVYNMFYSFFFFRSVCFLHFCWHWLDDERNVNGHGQLMPSINIHFENCWIEFICRRCDVATMVSLKMPSHNSNMNWNSPENDKMTKRKTKQKKTFAHK